MRRFLTGTDEAFADLERQAKESAFVQFRDVELPPGCVPTRARIGIKVDATTSASILYVEPGVRYYGPDDAARRWFRDGELLFPSFEGLRTWLTADLKVLFDTSVDAQGTPGETSRESLPTGNSATPAHSSPGAPSSAEAPQPASETPAPPREFPHRDDPVAGRLVELVMRQLGARHGVEVHTIDPPLVAALADRLRAARPTDDHAAIIEEQVGGALSLAAIHGHDSVDLLVGPPVTCTPTTPPA